MEERPEELRRQRELIAAHLRWLDDQIAKSAATGVQPTPAPSSLLRPAPADEVAATELAGGPAASESEALAGFRMPDVDPTSIRNEVKRGCILYVVIASVLMLSTLAIAWWFAAQE